MKSIRMQMTIKEILANLQTDLEEFKTHLSDLDHALTLKANRQQSDKEVLHKFTVLLKKYPLNSLLISRLLVFLQLVNEEELCDEYSLDDVGRTYDQLVDNFDSDIDLNCEAFYFAFNIENDDEKAIKLIQAFEHKVNEQISEIRKVVNNRE